MARKNVPPSYRLHKARNCAVSTINGKNIYHGPYGSLQSYQNFLDVLSRWVTEKFGRAVSAPGVPSGPDISINSLILAYWDHAKAYYVKDGRPTDEQYGIRAALRPLRQLYGQRRAIEIGPSEVKVVRESLIERDVSRRVINQYIERIKRMFKWAVEEQLVPPFTYQAIAQLSGLKKGRSRARETAPVRPVTDSHIEATLPELSDVLRAMVQFERLTGCRPIEACLVRPCDIDRSGSVWCYIPESHKTEHHGHERRIYIGPKAQAILAPYLMRSDNNYCFCPRESARSERSSPAVIRSNADRARRPRPSRRGERYSSDSYRRAIVRACARANIPVWTPNQLRHTKATELRQRYGLEATQTVLGHREADVTQIYAERDFQLARQIMAESG